VIYFFGLVHLLIQGRGMWWWGSMWSGWSLAVSWPTWVTPTRRSIWMPSRTWGKRRSARTSPTSCYPTGAAHCWGRWVGLCRGVHARSDFKLTVEGDYCDDKQIW